MLLVFRLLRRKRYRTSQAVRFDAANPPAPLRWRPKLKVYGLLSGLAGGLGAVVLLAQYGVEPVTSRALSSRGLIGGAISGLVLPSAIFGLVVWRFNRKLANLGSPSRRLQPPARATVLLLVVATGGLLLLLTAGTAAAEVNGPCTATFAGTDAAGRTTSAGDAIEVPEDGSVNYTMSAPEDLQTWRFWLEYGPFTQVIAEGDKDAPDPDDRGLGLDQGNDDFVIDFESILGAPVVKGNTVAGGVLTSEYAWMGTGLYEVHGSVTTVSGTACDGVILIDVAGNPLTTVLGAAAAGVTAVGAIGVGMVAATGLRDGGELLDALDRFDGDGAGGTQTIVLTGDAARDVLRRGVGSEVGLDPEDQYDTYVEGGGQVATGRQLGTHGRVTGIGAVVDGENGELAVSVDVETFTPEPPTSPDEPVRPTPAAVPANTPTTGPSEAPGDRYSDTELEDAIMSGLESGPPVGAPAVVGWDVDQDNINDVTAFDTNRDGWPETVWNPATGQIGPDDPNVDWPPPLSGEGWERPETGAEGDRYGDTELEDAIMSGLESGPPVGAAAVGGLDLDQDNINDVTGFDTDGDGAPDTLWNPATGQIHPDDPADPDAGRPIPLSGEGWERPGADQPVTAPADEPPEPPEASAEGEGSGDPPRLDLETEWELGQRFGEEVQRRLGDGYLVRNPNLFDKVWNNLTDPFWNARTGQCGEFADWGAEWSRDFLTEQLGEGTVVDTISVNEASSLRPEGVLDHVDGLIQANHAATRVIAPSGERYVLDYWEYLGRSGSSPPKLIPEAVWEARWRDAVGSEAELMRSADEEALKRFIGNFGEERGREAFLRQTPGPSGQTIVNSWGRQPW